MSRPAPATPTPVWREPGMPALLALTAAGFAGYAALLPVSQLWAVYGGSDAAGAAISRWGIGTLADRHGIARFLWPLVLFTVIGLGLTALAVQNRGDTQVFLFLGAMAVVGVAYGGLQNLTLLLALAVARRHECGAASAVWNVGLDAGMGIGSVLVGAIATGFSFPVALLVAAAISLATLPLATTRRRV